MRYVTEPSRLADADLVVLPGSKSTVADLDWLRATGLADALGTHARAGRPVLGICGGYQMLGRRIVDAVESGRGAVHGLGLLDLEIEFDPVKQLARPSGVALGDPVTGYEIHHGRVAHQTTPPLVTLPGGTGEGADAGAVFGTHWHGLLENDGFRRALLGRVAPDGFTPAVDTRFAEIRMAQLDLLGDLVERHLDTDAVWKLIEHGVPTELPFVPPGDQILTRPDQLCWDVWRSRSTSTRPRASCPSCSNRWRTATRSSSPATANRSPGWSPRSGPSRSKRTPGSLKGRIWLAPDFDEPDQELEDLFNNGALFPDEDQPK